MEIELLTGSAMRHILSNVVAIECAVSRQNAAVEAGDDINTLAMVDGSIT